MSERCIPIGELVERNSWPMDDLRHDHLANCPRCQSLLLSFTTFNEPPDIPDGADLEDARARLTTDFRDQKNAIRTSVRESRQKSVEAWKSLIDIIFDFLLRPPVRIAMGGTVVLLLVIGLPRIINSPRLDLDSGILRNSEQPAGSYTIAAIPPVRQSNGALLAWQPATDVDSYLVRFFDSDFSEIAWFEAGLDTVLTLKLDALPVPNNEWETVFWRISGRRGADEVVHSRMMSLDLLE